MISPCFEGAKVRSATAIDLGEMALLSASAAAYEGTKQQSTTKNIETRVPVDVGADRLSSQVTRA